MRNVKDATLTLDDTTIKVDSNAKYVAGVYAESSKKENIVNINMDTVKMSVESAYNGEPYDFYPNSHTGVYGISGNDSIGEITVGNNSQINVKAKGDGWLRAWGVTGQFSAGKIEMKSGTTIDVENTAALGGEAVGIYDDSNNVILGANSTVNAKLETSTSNNIVGSKAAGVWVQHSPFSGEYSDPHVAIGANTSITVVNKQESNSVKRGSAYGIFNSFGTVEAGNKLKIFAEAGNSNGYGNVVGIQSYSNTVFTDTIVNIGDEGDIHTSNSCRDGFSIGVFAQRNSVTAGNDLKVISEAKGSGTYTCIGVYSQSSGYIKTGKRADISVLNNGNGENSFYVGLFAYGGSISLDDNSKITVISDKKSTNICRGIDAEGLSANVTLGVTDISVFNDSSDSKAETIGVYAANSSKVNISGGSITGNCAYDKEIFAIAALSNGKVNVNADGKQNIIVEGSLLADKSVAGDKSVIDLKAMNKDSYLLGTVTTDEGRTVDSTTDLTFNNKATWYLTGDSNVSNLALDNGIVDMTANARGNAHQVDIDKNLSGRGVFKLDLTYHDNDVTSYRDATDSDFIYIHGGNDSEQNIVFEDTGTNLGAMKYDDKLYFAQVKDGAATFGEGETVRAVNKKGIYDKLFTVECEDSASENLKYKDNGAYKNWYITSRTDVDNPNGDSPFHSYNAGFALWRDDDTLLKRLGELRFTNDEGGVWVRVIGKKLEDNRYLGFNTHAKTIQVGYDRKDVQEDGSGTWRKGFAIGYTEADTTFRSGKGENNYTDLTLYATNIRKHDHYWDLVARIGLINSEYDSAYGDHGDFDNWAGSISAEYGRKKKLNEDNWFIEPQAQLTYSYMWGDNYTTRNGIRVEQGDADSLLGRAGFVISKEIESERKYPHRYYAKAFVMHEFLDGGEGRMFFGGDHRYESCDFKDTWYVVGVGANVDMGNQCTFYFDAEKNFKAHIKMPYRIEAGLRWEF